MFTYSLFEVAKGFSSEITITGLSKECVRAAFTYYIITTCTGFRRIRSVETKKAYRYFSSVPPCERRQPCETWRCFNFRPMIFGGRFPSGECHRARFTCPLRAPKGVTNNQVDDGGMGKICAKKKPNRNRKKWKRVKMWYHQYTGIR